jgi:hypothetical protein
MPGKVANIFKARYQQEGMGVEVGAHYPEMSVDLP